MALDPFKKRMNRAVRLALNEVGRAIRDDVRQSISIRVQRSGGHIFRSEPGEPPRREKGQLWKSIKYKVSQGATSVEDVTVFSDDEKAPWLEFGTFFIEPRPFIGPARRRAKRYAKQLFKRMVNYYLGQSGVPGDTPADFGPVGSDDYPS